MDYLLHNYELLEELDVLLNAFPFDKEHEKKLRGMDLVKLREIYAPYVENDEVANAIHWNLGTLKSLLDKKPVRALDEVIAFSKIVLESNEYKEN